MVGHLYLLYRKFTAKSALKEFLKLVNIWREVTGKNVDCLKCPVRPCTALMKDELV